MSQAMVEIFPAAHHCAADQLSADDALRFALILHAFRKVQRRPGTEQSRFMHEMARADPRKLTARQLHFALRCAWEYRRQMPPGTAPVCDPGKFEEQHDGDE